jgi:hypothetical protein
MCGITGYVGPPISFYDALKRVPYWRGGDGVGVMYMEDGNIRVKKSEGDIANIVRVILQKQEYLPDADKYHLPDFKMESPLWIIHNRQGTRGSNKIENNHPFYLPTLEKWVMQNGTVSDLAFYRNLMAFRGFEMKSETDSELLGYLVHEDIMPRVLDVIENIKVDRSKAISDYVITPLGKLCGGDFGVYVMVDPKTKKIEIIKNNDRTLWLTRQEQGIWFTSELIPPPPGKFSQEEMFEGYLSIDIEKADVDAFAYTYHVGSKGIWQTLRKGQPTKIHYTSCDECNKFRIVFKAEAGFDICWECVRDNKDKFGPDFKAKSSTPNMGCGWDFSDEKKSDKLIHKLERYYGYTTGQASEAIQDETLCEVKTFYKKSHEENNRKDYEEVLFMRGEQSG